MTATLMLIDLQQGGDDPSLGRRGQPDAEKNAARLLNHWRSLDNPIIHIRHDSMDPNSPYAPDSPGNDFLPEVAPLDHETVIDKRTNNAFIGTDLMMMLEDNGTTELVVCGVHLEHCVESTVRMAGNLGFMVYLAADATASLDHVDHSGKKWVAEDVHALTLAILNGDYVKVVNCDDLIGASDQRQLQ